MKRKINIRTRKRGSSWSYAFECSRENGTRKVIEKGGFQSENEAYEAGILAYSDYKNNGLPQKDKTTVDDLFSKYIAEKDKVLKKTTIHSYKSVAIMISPIIGSMKVINVKPQSIDRLLMKLKDDDYSYTTISMVKSVLSAVFKYAIYPLEIIQLNPCEYVKIPKNAPKNITKRTIITPAMLEEYLSRVQLPQIRLFMTVAYYTGMRAGEILSLTWDRVDMENMVITIDRQLETRGGVTHFSTLKTKQSNRAIYFCDTLKNELLKWKEWQTASMERRRYKHIYIDKEGVLHRRYTPSENMELLEFVCSTERVGILSYQPVMSELKRLGINSHSFRHTHATLLCEGGASPKEVSARLGHSSIAVTQDIYTSPTQKMQKRTPALFDSVVNDYLQTSSRQKDDEPI